MFEVSSGRGMGAAFIYTRRTNGMAEGVLTGEKDARERDGKICTASGGGTITSL